MKDIQRNYLSSDYLIKIEWRMYFSQTFEQFKTLVQEEKKFTFSKIIILFLYANICSEKCKKRARMQHRYYTAWQRKKTRRSFLSVVSSIVSLELPFMWFLKCWYWKILLKGVFFLHKILKVNIHSAFFILLSLSWKCMSLHFI